MIDVYTIAVSISCSEKANERKTRKEIRIENGQTVRIRRIIRKKMERRK